MIEKIFIVFVIMEACGLILHILDSIRCLTDRSYYRKNQEKINQRDDEIAELNKDSNSKIKVLYEQVTYLCNFQAEMNLRLNELEKKSKPKAKKTKTFEEEKKDFLSARKAEEIGG